MSSAHPPVSLDPQLAVIMRSAIEESLTGMFGIPVRCDNPVMAQGAFDDKAYKQACVASILEMNQLNRQSGTFVMIFSRNAVISILESCDIHPTDDPAHMLDATEEIINVIYGGIKKSLNQLGYNLALGLPRTVSNDLSFLDKYNDQERIMIPFFTDGHGCHAVIIAKS